MIDHGSSPNPRVYDPEDSASMDAPALDYAKALGAKTSVLRVGTARAMLSEIVDADIQASVREAIGVIRSMTASVRDVELPSIPQTTFGTILLAEAYVFHAELLGRAAERYNPVIRMSAGLGRTISATSYIEARRDLERLRRAVRRVFSEVDLLLRLSRNDRAEYQRTGGATAAPADGRLQYLWLADFFRPLRLHSIRAARWPADRWTPTR